MWNGGRWFCWRLEGFLTGFISALHLLPNWRCAGSRWRDAGSTGLGVFALRHRWPPPASEASASAVQADAQQVCPIILAPHKQAEGSSELQERVGGEL